MRTTGCRSSPPTSWWFRAAAVESARLLLNSKSRLFPAGLGNRHDWVGRNLQGHTYTGAWGLFDFDTYDDLGPGASIAVCDYNHGNPGLIGGAMLANEFIRLPYQFVSTVPPGCRSGGAAIRTSCASGTGAAIAVQGPTQEIPMFESRVEVDPKVKDYWGIPVARLSGGKHPHTMEIGPRDGGKGRGWLKAAGAIRTWKKLAGTGHSAAASTRRARAAWATIRECRWWTGTAACTIIDNLYVIDGSVHVTNGGFNPVLTIMATAYHAAEQIVKGWKGRGA